MVIKCFEKSGSPRRRTAVRLYAGNRHLLLSKQRLINKNVMKKNYLFIFLICIIFQACDSGSKKTAVKSSTSVTKNSIANTLTKPEETNNISKTTNTSSIQLAESTTNLTLNHEQQNLSKTVKSFKNSVSPEQLKPKLLKPPKSSGVFLRDKKNLKEKIMAESDIKIKKFGKKDEKLKNISFEMKSSDILNDKTKSIKTKTD